MEKAQDLGSVGNLQKLEKAKKQILGTEFLEKVQSGWHLGFSPVTVILNFWYPEL